MFGRQLAATSLLVMAFALSAASLQSQDPIENGSRLRVRLRESVNGIRTMKGNLLEVRGDSVRIETAAGIMTTPLAQVRSVEISKGPGNHSADGFAIGLAIGALAPIVIGRINVGADQLTFASTMLQAALIGPICGGIGAIIGSGIKGEMWQPRTRKALQLSASNRIVQQSMLVDVNRRILGMRLAF